MKRADHTCGLLRSSRRERTRSITIPCDNTVNQSESKLVYTSIPLLLPLSYGRGMGKQNLQASQLWFFPLKSGTSEPKGILGFLISLLHETLGYQPPDRASNAINRHVLSSILSCRVTSSHNHGLLESLPFSE